MANGYIGKISAVVTANTSDLSRKLAAARGDFDTFANRLGSSITAASRKASDSIDGIYTRYQKLERSLRSALEINLRTDKEIRGIQQLVSTAEQINKPLDAAARSFEKLSLSAQGAFLPALKAAQGEAEKLAATLSAGGSITERAFAGAEGTIDRTAKAIQRLTQAQQLAAQSFTGNELQFGNPRLFETLSANARTTQRAAALPASALVDGDIARQIRALEQYQNAAVEAAAIVESLRLEPNVSPEVLLTAERRLESIIETARRAGRQIETEVANAKGLFTVASARPSSAGLGLFGTQGGTAEQRALSRARELSSEFAKLPESAQRGLAGLAGIAATLANRVDQGKADAEQLDSVLGRLAKKIEAANSPKASASTGLIVRPPDADISIAATKGSLVDDFKKLQTERQVEVRQALGRAIDDPVRALSGVQSGILGLKSSLDALPTSVRSQFIPAIKAAEDEFERLSMSPAKTIDEVESLAARIRSLRTSASDAGRAFDFRGSFGGEGVEGLNRGLDGRALQGYTAQLQLLQQALGRVSAEAAGPGVAAQNRLRNAISDAMQDGTIRTERQRQAIERLTSEAVEATAAVAGVSAGGLGRQVQRVGDIGRGGFDRFTLGVNQAVFAIDDFFSVTGGIEQRLRAIGNNVTQLGFVIGGTAGLVTALSAVLIGQGLAAYIRFANGGATAEQQSKLLNDALARQKSLVEELAEAFRSLGDTLANRVFSEPAKEARRLGREIAEIAKKQQELLRARAADLDAGVQGERVRQRVLQDEFDNETDPGRRIALQRQINAARRREQAAADAALARRPGPGDAREAVRRGIIAFRSDEVVSRRGDAAQRQSEIIRRDAEAAAASVPVGNTVADIRAQLRSLEQTAAMAPPGTGSRLFGFFGPRGTDGNQLVQIQQLITSLETPLRSALDDLSNQISRASFAVAIEIEAAQGDVADAISRGVRGAGAFQAALDATARELEAAQAQITAAQEIDNLDQREAAIRQAEGVVGEVQRRIDGINNQARNARLGRGFGGERTTTALSGLSGERFTNEEASLRARLRSAIDEEEQARRALGAAIQRGDEAAIKRANADLEAAQAVSDLAAAAAKASIALEQAFARIRRTAENIVSQSEELANDAQRRLDEQVASDPRTTANRVDLRRERDNAERQLIQDRRRERELQNRLDRQRAEAASTPAVAAIDQQLEQLRSGRENAAEQARINGQRENPAVAENRANEIARLEAERAELIRQQTAATQALIDKENQLVAARRRAAERAEKDREFDEELARRGGLREADAIRGLDLTETPGQKAGREFLEQLQDIGAAFDGRVANLKGDPFGGEKRLKAEAEADAAVARAREDALRQTAPAIFGLADQVQNAILQGPSRAALQASDVSTVEGARELNRLLRGDDAGRDQNLVELQKQSQSLDELVRIAREGGAVIAN